MPQTSVVYPKLFGAKLWVFQIWNTLPANFLLALRGRGWVSIVLGRNDELRTLRTSVGTGT